jgi:hybrid polyketide synthase/nonribosomal peptide synthetase FtdB
MSLPRRPIAVVGLSCRFPQAEDPRALWSLLRDGRDAVREIPASRWNLAEVYHPEVSRAGTISTRFGAFLDQVDGFDWRTLRISPREARFMDPQHRLLLELSWEALEDAGIRFESIAGTRTGVYIGIKWNDYAKLQACRPAGIDGFTVNGSDLALAANRISYQFDLVGPSMAFDVGCASSLAAVHLACSGILSGETECAIAGGVNLMLSLDSFIGTSKANLLAPDGRCKMFDAAANGYVRSEGGGVVVLKALDRALADRDRIWGVIRGSAVMHNGRTEWIMASSPEAQHRLMREAIDGSGVDPAQIGYVELHGTGTRKGDPIEARAVAAMYGGAGRPRPLLVGSIKTNIGHAEAAAGLAGLAKVLVSMEAGEIPRNLHFNTPNPDIPLDELGLQVVTERTPWTGPRIAAINSLSLGGGNAHLVVEQGPAIAATPLERAARPALLVLSARSEPALRAQAGRFARCLAAGRDSLRDVLWTAAVRRTHHEHRLAVTGTAVEDFVRRLDAFAAERDVDGVAYGAASGDPRPVFVFSGQGTTWLGMARALLATEPVFRDALVACDGLLRHHVDWSLQDQLALGEGAWQLDRTDLAQPAIFAIQLALAALWRSWGIEPAAVVGHSIGELAAACVAGAISAEDAARIACARGRLMQSVGRGGAMLRVGAAPAAIAGVLAAFGGRVEIAAYNGPAETVLSGPREAIDAIAGDLTAAGVVVRPLGVDYAFHSRQFAAIISPLVEQLGDIAVAPPSVPLYSTLTGAAARVGDFAAPYWGRQLREPVRWFQAVDALAADGHDVFLEIGPAAVLGDSIRDTLRARAGTGTVVASGRRGRDDRQVLLGSAAQLHVRGVALAFDRLLDQGRVVAVPSYAWQRERLWFDAAPHAAGRSPVGRGGDPNGVADGAGRSPVGSPHPLLARHTALASPRGMHVWETTLDPAEQPWLTEHAVGGVPILPASAYLEAVVAAVEQVLGWNRCRLVDVELVRALVLRGPVQLQVAIAPEGDAAVSFTIHARGGDGATAGEWMRHVSGRAAPLAPGFAAANPFDAAAVAARAPSLDRAACYAELAAAGLGFGPSFQGIDAAWCGDGEVVARIAVPGELATELARYRFHPALLDACMHALPLALATRGERGCMPTQIRDVCVFAGAGTPAWTRVRLRGGADPAWLIRADIEVFDRDGAPAFVVHDLGLQWLDASAGLRPARSWCYRVAYRERLAGASPAAPAAGAPWLVLGDRAGLGEALAQQLRARGEQVSLIAPGAESIASRLAAAWPGGPPRPRRIVYLGTLDAGPFDPASPAELAAQLEAGCGAVLALVQHLARDDRADAALWLVTRGARRVETEAASPVQAAIWGLGRTIAHELPGLWGGLVDLDPARPPDGAPAHAIDEAAELASYLSAPAGGDDVAIRGRKHYVPRLVRDPVGAIEPVAIRPDGAYLVTGGFGGLGHLVARWLIRHGARTIVLLGRTALPPRAAWDALDPSSPAARQARQVAELEQLGATVHAASVDLARGEVLARWRDDYRAHGGPAIRGVIHCAGQVAFEPLVKITPAGLRDVLGAKAVGAAWLHAVLADEPLEMFALFSSAAAVLDSPMLGHYAAANAFLDAFAHARAHRGLPAVSINWGPWSEVGMVTRNAGHGPAAVHGAGLIEPEVGLELFGRIAAAGRSQIAVLPMDWQAWRAAHPSAAAVPLLAELIPPEPASAPTVAPASSAAAPGLDAPGLDAMIDAVRMAVARALFFEGPAAVAIDRPIRELGFDSLMATELSAELGKQIGAKLPATIAFDHPTPRALAEHLMTRLPAAAPPGVPRGLPAAPPASPPPAAPATASQDPRLTELSLGQERLYFLDRLEPGTTQYVEFFALQVDGALDVDLLRRSLAALVRRHEALRTVFPEVAVFPEVVAAPRALIASDGPVALDVVDLRGVPDPATAAATAAAAVLGRPFDLARGPLWRGLVLTFDDHRHTLWFAQHHIITDATSIGRFADELARLYRSGADPRALPALRAQHSDFVRGERARTCGAAYQDSVAWWRTQLDELPRLELPHARGRATAARAGDAVAVELPPALVAQLKDFTRREGCTVFEAVLAAWACTLHRYTAQTEFAIGTMVAHDRSELGGVLGFFVNTVVLRCDLSGRPTFAGLARRLGAMVRQTLDHRDVDFGEVVRGQRGQGGQDPRPLVQATLNLVPAFPPPGAGEPSGWGWADTDWVPVPRPAKFELSLELVDSADGLHGKLEYPVGMFERATAQQLARHFARLLGAGISCGELAIEQLPMLTAGELHTLVTGWNATDAAYPERCLHQLFEDQAARTPEAIAVVAGGDELRYRDLDAQANRLAHHLVALGVGPEVRVAVCMTRSAKTVVALLAILKASGAYVPLDPAHPRERIAFMLEDSRPAVVITDAATRGRLPAHSARQVCLETAADAIAACPVTALPTAVGPDHVAYAIYTSGSTGRPKAVLGLHRGAVNFLSWLWAAFPFEAGEVCAQKTSLSFVDAFVEIFAPLLRGVPLVVVPDRVEKDPVALIDLLARHRVTRLVLVPSLLAAILETGGELSRRLPRLKYWLLSGERLPDALCDRLHAEVPGAVVLNTYGSSEVSANVTWARCRPGEPVTIGRPLSNTRVYVLDADRQPVPIGVPGELYVGGAGLARGYLSQPERTAERFVQDPFAAAANARLYRTGDRVRWLADGTLDYLGRFDDQIKLRGHRIELGELDAVLCTHPDVQAAVAMVREDVPSDPRLVAYVVPRESPGPTAAALREHLGARLPEVMVPSAFEVLDRLPLTASGKIDRKALAARAAPQAPVAVRERVSPRGATAQAIAEIWKDVLGVAEVDARHTFFELGGNSLLLVRVQHRLRAALDVDVTVAELFGYPTIDALAHRLAAVRPAEPVRAVPREPVAAPAAARMSVHELERLIDDKYLENTSHGRTK